MPDTKKIRNLPLHGFTWRIDENWLSSSMDSKPTIPLFERIWDAYYQPLQVNVVRFHVNVMAFDPFSRSEASARVNALLVTRLVSFCRYAESRGVWLVPMLVGTGQYRQGKEWQYPARVYHFLRAFIRELRLQGIERLYKRILLYQIEDEMNHPVRHAFWPSEVFIRMLRDACRQVRHAEEDERAPLRVPRMAIFSADWMFVKDLFRRPRAYVRMIHSLQPYQFDPPVDLLAFLEDDQFEVIGLDSFPGIYCPFVRFSFVVNLVRYLCENYGVRSSYRKHWLVAETGYATAHPGHRGELNQLHFYQVVFRGLSEYCWYGRGRESGFLGLLWYCFNDQPLRFRPYPFQEVRFGVVKPEPSSAWFATYPAQPKATWHWMRTALGGPPVHRPMLLDV
jgi:hypothetical protein